MFSLFPSIQAKRLSPDGKYSLVCNLSTSGIFTVKSLHDILMGGQVEQFPRKMIWNSSIPTKVSFFVWEAWWERS